MYAEAIGLNHAEDPSKQGKHKGNTKNVIVHSSKREQPVLPLVHKPVKANEM